MYLLTKTQQKPLLVYNTCSNDPKDKITIRKSKKITKELTKDTSLDKCKSIVVNLSPLQQGKGDILDFSNFMEIKKSYIFFEKLDLGVTKGLVLQIPGEKGYITCLYGYDGDSSLVSDSIEL